MGKSSGSQKVTTNTIAEPPAFQKPFLEFGMNEAKNLYTGAPTITGYTTQSVLNPAYVAPTNSSASSSAGTTGWDKYKNAVAEPYADNPSSWGGASSYSAALEAQRQAQQAAAMASNQQYITQQTPQYSTSSTGGKIEYFPDQQIAGFQPEQEQAWNMLKNYMAGDNTLSANANQALTDMLNSQKSALVTQGQDYLSDVLGGKYLNPTDNSSYNYLTDVMNGKNLNPTDNASYNYLMSVMNGDSNNILNSDAYKYITGIMNGSTNNISNSDSYKYLTGIMNGSNNNIQNTAGYNYFKDVVGGKYLPASTFDASAYAMDPFSYNPEANPYYDRIVEKALGAANANATANGAYGSSDWLNLRGNTASDLYANQYNQERNWYEAELALAKQLYENRWNSERGLMNNAGNSLIGADQFQNNQQINAGNSLMSADQTQTNQQLNAGNSLLNAFNTQTNNQMNAGGNLLNYYQNALAQQQNAGNSLLNFYQGERNNQQQAAQMVPSMDQAGWAQKQAALGMMPSINNMNLQNFSALENIGLQRQQNQQAIIDANKAKWDFEQMEPWKRLQLYQQAINGNMGQSTSETKNVPTSGSNPFTGAIGGALAGGALSGMTNGAIAGPTGALIGGGLGLLGSFF